MFIATLSSASFAYMLAVIQAPGVPGLDSEPIIPAPDNADEVYAQGLADLKQDNLLVAGARPGTWTLNDDLLTTLMVMAGATYATRVLRRDGDVFRFALGYIADNQVAELVPLKENRYQVGLLESHMALAERTCVLLLSDLPAVADPSMLKQAERTGEFVIAKVEKGELKQARAAYAHSHVLQIETGPDEASRVTKPLTPNELLKMMTTFMQANI